MKLLIRNYEVNDFEEVIRLWNISLPGDSISPLRFQTKVLADSNFDPEGCQVAEINGNFVAFMLGIVRKEPLEGIGLQKDLGWITIFFVHPEYRKQGIAGELMIRLILF